MSNKSTIDNLFKDHLSELPLNDKEALWSRMEKRLDENKGSGKKVLILLLCLFITGAVSMIFLINRGSKSSNDSRVQQNIEKPNGFASTILATQQPHSPAGNSTLSQQGSNLLIHKTATVFQEPFFVSASTRRSIDSKGKYYATIVPATVGLMEDENILSSEDAILNMREFDAPLQAIPLLPINKISAPMEKIQERAIKTFELGPGSKKSKLTQRPSLGLSGGVDLFLKARETGGYAGIQLSVPLNRKVNLVTGILLSSHKMEESYSNAEKQRLTPDKKIDAKLQGLTVLQVPILYEQPLPGKRLRFGAGITPTYIINAGIYNVPNAFAGNIAPYRKFTLSDLHRLNVLFTATAGIAITKHIDLELKGNYGLTELVKNSYINQSSINNNFKSAQVGVVYKFGKK